LSGIYTEDKFKSLSFRRQAEIVLNRIEQVEKEWDDLDLREQGLKELKVIFLWLIEKPSENFVKTLNPYLFDENISLRQLLDQGVPFERYLEKNIKDEHLVPVIQGDATRKERFTQPLFLVLDHLRSSFNVGSLFRTAECLGVQHIYLVGYTPTPADQAVCKTARGTEKIVSWSHHHHLSEVRDILSRDQVSLVALETVKGSKALSNWQAPSSLALLVGNERFGLSQKSLQLADEFVHIPMQGGKNSLNVANALSIASFEVLRQWTE
jgi:23S rRNA (guanosine2251-2'-O)-methyltransferase